MTARPKPLARCPVCGSRLIYPLDQTSQGIGTVVRRRCPECEHHDRVLASKAAVDVWRRHLGRHETSLAALAEAMRAGLLVEAADFHQSSDSPC